MQARLAARDIACRRGDRLLFRGFSADLDPGEALHVTGPNGCGKSSLLRILAGLLRAEAGSVAREGQVGLVEERTALAENRTLGEALTFWQRLDGGAAQSEHALNVLGLKHLRDIPVRYLSTGQRKRAALARLVRQDAAIWLLDEPLNGLDGEGMAAILRLVGSHRDRGGICVIASHLPLDLPGLRRCDLPRYAA